MVLRSHGAKHAQVLQLSRGQRLVKRRARCSEISSRMPQTRQAGMANRRKKLALRGMVWVCQGCGLVTKLATLCDDRVTGFTTAGSALCHALDMSVY